MKNYKGFTLIELLIAVLIIGILAAIALPQYQLSVDKSRYTEMMVAEEAISSALERYYLTYNYYPEDMSALDISFGNGTVSGRNINFDWGYCTVSSYMVDCWNTTTLKNIYSRFLSHLTIYHGNENKRLCYAYGTTNPESRGDKLCRKVTGNETHYTEGTNTLRSYAFL
jgi:type IV pilus assembly protein PilE